MNDDMERRVAALELEIRGLRRKLYFASPDRAYVSPDSSVDPTAEIDPSTRFHGTVTVGKATKVKRDAEITQSTIGDYSTISRGVTLRPKCIVGNWVVIGSFTLLMTGTHEIGPARQRAGKLQVAEILVGDGAWIGSNVTVLGGVTIGSGAIVGAGSLVTRDVAPNTIFSGVPAKFMRALGCVLWVLSRSAGVWAEPVMLDDSLPTGHRWCGK